MMWEIIGYNIIFWTVLYSVGKFFEKTMQLAIESGLNFDNFKKED